MKENSEAEGQIEAPPRHTTSTSRRRLLYLIGAGSMAGLAGCSGGGGQGTDTTTNPGTGTATETGTEAELKTSATIGIPQNVTGDFFTPWGMTPYWTRVLEGLAWSSPKLKAKPWLATDWKRTGEKTWEFSLRENVNFHNGDTLNAERVLGSFKNIFKPNPGWKDWAGIKELSKVDDMRVGMTTKKPLPNLPEVMTHPFFGIQHPDSSKDQKWGGTIATGPYKVENIKPNQHVKLSAFEEYWQDPPKMEKATLRFIEDNNTLALALAGGRIDVALDLPPTQVETLKNSNGIGVEMQKEPTVAYYNFNQHVSPTDDVQLRKALNYAVSQEKIIEGALSGVGGEPARGITPSMVWWSAHDSLPKYGPDKAKAKGLVEESDYNGETLTLLTTPQHPFADNPKLTAQVVKQQAKEVGVKIEIQSKEFAAFNEAEDNIPEKDFHLWLDGSETVNASAMRFVRDYTSGGSQADVVTQDTRKKLDSLFDKGFYADDPEVKKEAWGEMERILVEEVVVVIPLYYHKYVSGFDSKMKRFDWHPLMVINRWENLELLK